MVAAAGGDDGGDDEGVVVDDVAAVDAVNAVDVVDAVADADLSGGDSDCDRCYCGTFGLNEADEDESGGGRGGCWRVAQQRLESLWVNREKANCHDADDSDSSDLD